MKNIFSVICLSVLILIGVLSIAKPAFSELYSQEPMSGGFYWTPLNSYHLMSDYNDTYYCSDGVIRDLYPKKHIETMKLAGVYTTTPEAFIKSERLYKAGKCRRVTSQKECTYSFAKCYVLYSNGSYLSVNSCFIHPDKYKQFKNNGMSDVTIKSMFSEAKISSDALNNKCK